jgi:hypothetical protein
MEEPLLVWLPSIGISGMLFYVLTEEEDGAVLRIEPAQ